MVQYARHSVYQSVGLFQERHLRSHVCFYAQQKCFEMTKMNRKFKNLFFSVGKREDTSNPPEGLRSYVDHSTQGIGFKGIKTICVVKIVKRWIL